MTQSFAFANQLVAFAERLFELSVNYLQVIVLNMLFFPTAYFQNTLPPVALNLSQTHNQLESSYQMSLGVVHLLGNRELQYLLPTMPTTPPKKTRLADLPGSQRDLIDNKRDRNNLHFLNNIADWLKHNQVPDLKRLEIPGNYPEKVRSTEEPNSGTVAVAVTVDENGKIISDTVEVIASSFSNGDFDDEALSAVWRHSFPATGKREAYLIRVQFKKDRRVPSRSILSPIPATTPNLSKPQNSPLR